MRICREGIFHDTTNKSNRNPQRGIPSMGAVRNNENNMKGGRCRLTTLFYWESSSGNYIMFAAVRVHLARLAGSGVDAGRVEGASGAALLTRITNAVRIFRHDAINFFVSFARKAVLFDYDSSDTNVPSAGFVVCYWNIRSIGLCGAFCIRLTKRNITFPRASHLIAMPQRFKHGGFRRFRRTGGSATAEQRRAGDDDEKEFGDLHCVSLGVRGKIDGTDCSKFRHNRRSPAGECPGRGRVR